MVAVNRFVRDSMLAHCADACPTHAPETAVCSNTMYRPITLLNTDYKIFTRVLAIRMREVVHEFVEECQKGFMPKTFISEATMLLRLVEAHINEEPTNRKGIFLFLDMEKAFDRVSYDFTKKALEAYGFGKKFRTWV